MAPEINALQALVDGWKIIAASITVSVALACGYLMQAPKVFTAQADLLIETNQPSMFQMQLQEPLVTLDTPQFETQLAILRSDRITEKVMEATKLLDGPTDSQVGSRASNLISALIWQVKALFDSNPVIPDRKRDLIAEIQRNLDVQRQGLSHVINITYDAGDPKTAAMMANAIAQAYVSDQLDSRSVAAEQSSKWLEERISLIRAQMNMAAQDVQKYRVRRGYKISEEKDVGQGIPANNGQDRTEAFEKTTLEELESRLETYRKIYQSYLQAYADAVQRQSYPVASARLITPAKPPLKKSKPRTLPTLAISALAGAVFGAGLCLLLFARSLTRNPRASKPRQ